jgi:hypothetical protein
MRTGRPLGQDSFLQTLEIRLGRTLKRKKPGPKPKPRSAAQEGSPGHSGHNPS